MQHMDNWDGSKEKVYETYQLDAHGITADVRILDTSDFVPIYETTVPGIGEATKVLLLSLKQELLSLVPIDINKIEDKEYLAELNYKYTSAAELIVNKYLPGTTEGVKQVLIAYIINMMLGLGDLEVPLADDNLEEIAINSAKENIWVFHKKYGWCKTNMVLHSEDIIYDDAEQIGRKVGRQINNLAPLMDAELPDGSRINATLYPVSQNGNTITIRKFSKNPWTMPMLIGNKTVSSRIAGMIWLCLQNEISVIIAGGTASGKTSFLNAIGIFIPPSRRVISVEETKELTLPKFLQWVPMLTRQSNPEGKGQITLYDLMINTLRQRPDVLLVGEIRTKNDAQTLFEAIHTGHAVYGTVHADNAEDTIIRMTNPPIDTPKIMLNAIGAIIVMFRHRRLGIRRVFEFAELLNSGDANVLTRWDIRNDKFVTLSSMTRLGSTIAMYTGYTQNEIEADLDEKEHVLDWMVENKLSTVDDAGYVVSSYYKDKERVLKAVNAHTPYNRDMFN